MLVMSIGLLANGPSPLPPGTTPAALQAVPVAEDEIVRGDPSRPWVSLVFNVGAGSTPGEQILDTLREREVRTTFFILGWWAERQPELVRRIFDDGHEVASHGHSVFDLTSVRDAEVIADLEHADAVLSGITGQTTRPLWSPSAGYRDARVRRLAASIGYRPIYWTLDSGDWQVDATADGVRQRVLGNAANGSIIVMHFDSPRTADTIAAALPSIVDGLRERGYRLVTITELVTGPERASAGNAM
jgi:peptidoglycan/xylan/chitin deacetylase (PgdA/CDA1 family)